MQSVRRLLPLQDKPHGYEQVMMSLYGHAIALQDVFDEQAHLLLGNRG